MSAEPLRDDLMTPALEDFSIGFEERLAYDKMTFFYLSLPTALIGQLFGALLLSALVLSNVRIYEIAVWLSISLVMFVYRFYHYYAFRRASEYSKLVDAKVWLHKYYTNILISGIIWGSSAILLFPDGDLVGQMTIVLFLFAISFTSMGVLASKHDLLLGFMLAVFLPIILRFFFLDEGETHLTMAYVVTALMLMLLLIAYYFGGVINSALRNHQYFVEIKHSHDKLKERFFSLFERAPVGIYYFDRNLKIQDLNQQFLVMHRAAFKEDLVDQDLGSLKNESLLNAHHEALRNHTGSYRGPYDRFFHQDAIYVDLSTVPMTDNEGEVTGGITIIKDITAEVTAKEKMVKNAYYDMLTEVPNRTLLMDWIQTALVNMEFNPLYGALLFIDIDHFKRINETYGHDIGDTVIKQVALRIEGLIGEQELLSRIGGDKFVILLADLGNDIDGAKHHAMAKALEIKRKFVQPLTIGGSDSHMTISMGIAIFHGSDGTPFDILKRAETAMYHAKKSGRNTVSFYKNSMGVVAEEELVIENELVKALHGNELQIYYQPQLGIDNDEIVSAEALVRWFHPEKGAISPEKFITIAEESGLIVELENWIFERIFKELREWYDKRGDFILDHIAINVSAIHFLKPYFVEQFMLLLNKYEINPSWIELELTEGEVMHNIHEAIRKIKELRTFGISFSIDDFGTGYSSFAYLKQLPVDVLKIDQAFVLNMADNHEDAQIVSAIISIARKFGLKVLAEGVETERALELLREMGCDTYQGYYAYKPMPYETFVSVTGGGRKG